MKNPVERLAERLIHGDSQKAALVFSEKNRFYFTQFPASDGALLVTAVLTCIVACNQSLSIILTDQLCGDIIPDKDRMAAALEDTCVVIAALIPWSVACATPLATLSAPTTALLAACYLYLLPLCHFWMGRFVRSEGE